MRRIVWAGLGAAATVVVLRRARRVVRLYTASGPAAEAVGTAARLAAVARGAREEFRSASAERARQLREDLLGGAQWERDGGDAAGGRRGRRATRAADGDTAGDPDDVGYEF